MTVTIPVSWLGRGWLLFVHYGQRPGSELSVKAIITESSKIVNILHEIIFNSNNLYPDLAFTYE